MTNSRDFYFGLLRISMLQLLKAEGFDRAKPSTVYVITDLYCQYLKLLINEINFAAQSRQDVDDTISLQDISMAFQKLGLIRPYDSLDVYDENPNLPSDIGMKNFRDWCIHNTHPKNARAVALPMAEMLKATNDNSLKTLSTVPEYINQLQNKDSGFKPQNSTIYYNSEGNIATTSMIQDTIDDNDDELIEELIANGDTDDWIKVMLAKQRINLAKKVKGIRPSKLEELPSVTGLKYSVLDPSHISSLTRNDTLPTYLDRVRAEGTSPTSYIEGTLLNKLPIMQPSNKLDNISLSFDTTKNESDSDSETSDNSIEEDTELQANYNSAKTKTNISLTNSNNLKNKLVNEEISVNDDVPDEYANSGLQGTEEYVLSADTDTQFAEMTDMDNTFQRRQSLDYGDGSYDNEFNFNGF
ncbi:hypothetical protein TBLA_0C00620 [Henningerozyma blattae CBS 6284]|uniref:Bromodomain associated domain-containing protein n=1 Tax=Henningerozyma blattae (strain ATCC 34711 / CBS 6284 / DSM 70876 / NBRC 10599 / NRRL Y-10934 / UCD 77-7) TaxID=1071380 RepID=I2H0H6_HENB6|nr:hypothetical protein TBLA_0C00620 [Tetrapisispora blattae CBS 6284]CCH59878.1 hypothetical protein TBLA_0C00620 [Tetrapisispora blattae CBS 6284]